MNSRTYEVRVEGIKFDAAHFATYGGRCEPLHGHTYEVAAEAVGSLNEDSLVLNFITLKTVLRDLAKELDHRFMLQGRSRVVGIECTETAWKVRTPSGTGYVMPTQDVVFMEVDNTTAERLAEWFSGRLLEALEGRGASSLTSFTVEVWEGPGQCGSYRVERLPVA
jgi:6-pyruvoyltetrahydropterin/6-carboxytetrahydropterin synthase